MRCVALRRHRHRSLTTRNAGLFDTAHAKFAAATATAAATTAAAAAARMIESRVRVVFASVVDALFEFLDLVCRAARASRSRR